MISRMYKDTRPVQSSTRTASTPEMWAATFASSTRMNPWRTLRFRLTKEWALIRKHVPPSSNILDAGCGFGEWVSFLEQEGYRAAGLDYSKELVDRLRETYPRLTWKEGDIRHIPWRDASFGAVISWGVIEHDEDGPSAALRDFWRVLTLGGVSIVTVPLDSPVQRRASKYLYQRDSRPQAFFQYFMTADDLSAYMQAAGFDVVEEGILPNAVLQLVSPPLALRLTGLAFRIVNFFVSSFMSWLPRYCVMRYAVGVKRAVRQDGVAPQ